MYKLQIDVPGLQKDAGVQIAGIGTFDNGDTVIVTDEEHDAFRRYHGRVVPVTNKKNEIVGSELKLGPTLVQAKLHGIKVETYKESAAEKKAREEEEAAAEEAAVIPEEPIDVVDDDDNQEGDES